MTDNDIIKIKNVFTKCLEDIPIHKQSDETKDDLQCHELKIMEISKEVEGLKRENSTDHQNINKTMDTNHKQIMIVLSELKDQAKKTNGRINKLEVWKATIIGSVFVLSGVLGWLTNDYMRNRDLLVEIANIKETVNSLNNALREGVQIIE